MIVIIYNLAVSKNPWKKISSKIVYENPWIKVIEDSVIRPDGKQGKYGYVKTNGPSVFIFALTDDDEVNLVGLYRYTSGEYSWELPAGNSEGKDLLKAAKRELLEETGLSAKIWEEAGSFWVMNGVVKEKSYVYIAKGLTQTKQNEMRKEGINAICKVSVKELNRMILNGALTDGQSIAAIMQACLYLKLL